MKPVHATGSMTRSALWSVCIGLLLAIVHLAPDSWAEQTETRRYAVIVGYNLSSDSVTPKLSFADDDAVGFYELLEPGSARTYLLTTLDSESQQRYSALQPRLLAPRRDKLLTVAAELRAAFLADAAAGRRSELTFYYAGHGDVQDGKGYINLADGRLFGSEFRDAFLGETRADRVHVIIDACKSYYFVSGRGPGGRREGHPRGFATPTVTEGVGYILSTSSDTDSHEWAELGSGVFSHEVRSALLGAADANTDGAVDYEELAAFVAVANEGVLNERYRPQVYIRGPRENLRASVLPRIQSPRLRLDQALQGRLRVTDDRGVRYLDSNKAAGSALELRLLAGRRYDVSLNGSNYELLAVAGKTHLRDIEPGPASPVARSEGHRAFSALYSRPFGPAVVRGFRLGGRAAPATIEDSPADVSAVSIRDATRTWEALPPLGRAAATVGGEIARLDAPSQLREEQRNPLWLVVAGAGVATLGAAALTNAAADARFEKVQDREPELKGECAFDKNCQLYRERDEILTLERWRNVLIASGATLAVGGVAAWLLLTEQPEEDSTSNRVGVWLNPDVQGMYYHGSF